MTTDHTALVLAGGAPRRAPDAELARRTSAKKTKTAKKGRKAKSDEPAGSAGAPKEVRVRGLVLIDPGHGGKDEGARGPRGTKEKAVVLEIARLLAEELRREGVRAELTRTDDSFVSLSSRAALANRLKPDLLVSLHVNSYPVAYVAGIETWVALRRLAAQSGPRRCPRHAASKEVASESRALARKVQAALVEATGERDRGVRAGHFTVLRRSKAPAVIVETGFISNPKTERKLARAAYRAKIAKALAGAIMKSGLLKERVVK